MIVGAQVINNCASVSNQIIFGILNDISKVLESRVVPAQVRISIVDMKGSRSEMLLLGTCEEYIQRRITSSSWVIYK